MANGRQKEVRLKPGNRSHSVLPGITAVFALSEVLLVMGLAAGCAGISGQIKTASVPPTPSPQTLQISGTIAPAADGTGATLTLGGTATGTVNADSSGNYTFSGLTAGTYVVTPNKSGFSFSPANQSVTLSTANATALNFSAAAVQARSAALSWTASTTPTAGYDIYRSTTNGGPYLLLNSVPVTGLTYTDATVQSGQTYFYVTTAVDGNGVQSVYSNQAQAVIP